MSVIIRLQNLPWSANALDIRQHFQGLSIPEGGVHIVGGEQGDAFIAFSTDEDARQAMMTDGGKIKEVKLKLMLSSRAEMQKVIEQARQQSVSLQNLLQMPAPPITAVPLVVPTPPAVTVVTPVPTLVPDAPKIAERRDSDATSNSSRDRDRRKDRSRSRDRDRNRDRRDRDRKRRSRSRDRSRRGRRSRSRERSRDRDRKRPGRDGDTRRDNDRRDVRQSSLNKDEKNKESNGSINKPGPVDTPVWESMPIQLANKPTTGNFNKGPLLPNRNAPGPADMPLGRGDMDGRRIMGSGPFPAGAMRPLPEAIPNPFPGREGWPQGRPPIEVGGRFPVPDRSGGFMGADQAPGFGNEGNDFDGRGDFMPRIGMNFRGGSFRGMGDIRRPFLPGRMGAGPGTILGPPGILRPPFSHSGGPIDNYQRSDEFSKRPFPSERFNRGYEPRGQVPGACVQIQNIALDAGYRDLRKLFQGIYIANDAIKMINDTKGNRIGIAYIRFSNVECKEQALKMSGKDIRGSVVEILHIDDEIFDKALDSFKPDRKSEASFKSEIMEIIMPCLHIEDLPAYVKDDDVIKLFPDFSIADVFISGSHDEKKSGAFVKFVAPDDAKKAFYSHSKHMMGHKHVKVSLCTLDQYYAAKAQHTAKESKAGGVNGSPARGHVDVSPSIRTDCILLRSLPYQTNDRDILDFFSDVALVPVRIHIMLDNFNKPSGDAYCEFQTFEETKQAVVKHNAMLGKQEISVKPVSRSDMLEALGLTPQPDVSVMPIMGGPRMMFPRNFPGNRPMGILGNGPRMPMMNRPMGSGPMMGPGLMGHPTKDAPVEGFGKPGCVLALENIPFRAEVDEILEFFRDFEVSRDNIIRRFNDSGYPTGDARVAFASPAEAQRAQRELRGEQIRGRQIFCSVL